MRAGNNLNPRLFSKLWQTLKDPPVNRSSQSILSWCLIITVNLHPKNPPCDSLTKHAKKSMSIKLIAYLTQQKKKINTKFVLRKIMNLLCACKIPSPNSRECSKTFIRSPKLRASNIPSRNYSTNKKCIKSNNFQIPLKDYNSVHRKMILNAYFGRLQTFLNLFCGHENEFASYRLK